MTKPSEVALALAVPAGEFGKYFNDDVERWARLVKEGKVAPLQ